LIKVMVVDDHALVRAGLKSMLEQEKGIVIVAEAEDGEQAINLARDTDLDVVLMDIEMPGIDGMEATAKLLRINPKLKVIILSSNTHPVLAKKLLTSDVKGYLSKEAGREELLEAIRRIVEFGEKYVSAEITRRLVDSQLNTDEASPFDDLSYRELQIVLMILRGLSPKEITRRLFLSIKTVSAYRGEIFRKLGVQNDVEMILLAKERGLLAEVY